MLRGEARRTASILHQTPGWRWRRELCLTERSQQCQSGPTTKAWRRLPARQRHDACETPSEHLRGAVQKLERNACQRGNVRGIVRGTCGEHCRSCMEMGGPCGWHRQARAGVDSIVSKDMQAAPLGSTQVAASKGVRVAPPDSIVRASAGSTDRNTRIAPLKLDRPIVRVLPVHNDGGVSRYRA